MIVHEHDLERSVHSLKDFDETPVKFGLCLSASIHGDNNGKLHLDFNAFQTLVWPSLAHLINDHSRATGDVVINPLGILELKPYAAVGGIDSNPAIHDV